MANGYASAILQDLSAAINSGSSKWKVDMHGFTQMLYTGNGASPIRVTAPDTGGKRTFNYWYRKRATMAQTDTSYSCDNVLTPARVEASVSTPNTAQIAWHLPDELITNYDGVTPTGANWAGQPVSPEMVDIVYSSCNAILGKVNSGLQGLITWGRNRVSGNSSAVSVNLPQAQSTMVLGNGIAKIKTDAMKNGFASRFNMVGLGLMYDYLAYAGHTSSSNQAGFDNRIAANGFDFYADQIWETSDGLNTANLVGVFNPGSIQIVEYLETDFRKGKLANSTFFQITLPTVDPAGNSVPVRFDAQLKEIDCPTTLTDAYSGQTATYNRGYSLVIWKNYGLFQEPADSFRNEDPMIAVNGSLRYAITNNA